MNWYRPTSLVVALLVSGCGTGSAANPVLTHGTLVRVGGPAPGAPVPIAGAAVHLQDAAGSADVRTDRRGRFVLDVGAGTYHVTITAGGSQADSSPIQPVPQVIHVPPAGSLRLVVNIR